MENTCLYMCFPTGGKIPGREQRSMFLKIRFCFTLNHTISGSLKLKNLKFILFHFRNTDLARSIVQRTPKRSFLWLYCRKFSCILMMTSKETGLLLLDEIQIWQYIHNKNCSFSQGRTPDHHQETVTAERVKIKVKSNSRLEKTKLTV